MPLYPTGLSERGQKLLLSYEVIGALGGPEGQVCLHLTSCRDIFYSGHFSHGERRYRSERRPETCWGGLSFCASPDLPHRGLGTQATEQQVH